MTTQHPNPTGTSRTLMEALERGAWDEYLARVYGPDQTAGQRNRYIRLLKQNIEAFGDGEVTVFQAPGRAELSGNHTDHHNGLVMAAAVHLDLVAVVSLQENRLVTLHSDKLTNVIDLDLTELDQQPGEEKTSQGLIRGVAAWFQSRNYKVGGFKACLTSDITEGKGLSSSAAFEILIGRIYNEFYNDCAVSNKDLALAGRFAETRYFKKSCGLMDQMSSARSGLIQIDFKDPESPVVTDIDFDFSSSGYQSAVVDTGGSHADSPWDYNTIEQEMTSVVEHLGVKSALDVEMKDLYEKLPPFREVIGERAILRIVHFIQENERVRRQTRALSGHQVDAFLRLANESGDSSWRLLQNCYRSCPVTVQPIPLALTMTRYWLKDQGACRIHGGGFDGTILVFVPEDQFSGYKPFMENVFGDRSVVPLRFLNQQAALSGVGPDQ